MRVGKAWVFLVAVVMLLALPLAIRADQHQVDNDLNTSGLQNTVTLSASPGQEISTPGQIVIEYSSGNNHLLAGTNVTFEVTASQTTLPAPYTVSDVSVVVPNGWTSGNTVAGTSLINFTAPTEAGSYEYTVKWNATADYGNDLTGGSALTIKLNVVPQEEPPDCAPPKITITTPADKAQYILSQPVIADWKVEDGGCGIASEDFTVASGGLIDTKTVGPKPFTVSASDSRGNSATLTYNYTVVYGFGGFLPPLGPGPVAFQAGSTIPVKFQLLDYYGNVVGNASGIASIANVLASIRYDSSTGQYIANLKTPKGVTGQFSLDVNLNDGTVHSTKVVLK